MVEFWEGIMNWPLDKDWVCEICGNRGLIWGLVHGTCRCDHCHVQYYMRDANGAIVTTPLCQLKIEYYEATKEGRKKFKTPMSTWTDKQWDEAKALTK